ncbi:hypothetical protein BGX31_010037, partial [Mortierella sp. GBA43]
KDPLRIASIPDVVFEVIVGLSNFSASGGALVSLSTGLVNRRHARAQSTSVQRGMSDLNMGGAPMHANMVLYEHVVRMHEENHQQQQQIIRMQQQSIHMQQQTLDRIAIIQSSIQTLINQTFELHEHPIPRLFIVLPTKDRPKEVPLKLAARHFRLYFLCECGTYSNQDENQSTHEIHLAKHNGYEINNPIEFFEKYGGYILALMHMFKMGVTAAGMVVPSLSNVKIDEGYGECPALREWEQDLGTGVDVSIAFLESLKGSSGTSTTEDSIATNNLEILKGTDIKPLESYLKNKEGRVLGNLFRIVTPKGHVKWVCSDHRYANAQASATETLRKVVESNYGIMEEDLGEIRVSFNSGTAARYFYDALVAAPWIRMLRIGLKWEATMDDLRKLADAVTKANILDLTIDGNGLIGRTWDILHRFDRFDPLWLLGTNGKLQNLRFEAFRDVFYRLNHNVFTAPHKLRVLKLFSPIDVGSKSFEENLRNIIKSCPNVVELGIRLHEQSRTVTAMRQIHAALRNLRNLELYFSKLYTTVAINQGGKIQTIQLYVPVSKDLVHESQYYLLHTGDLNENTVRTQLLDILEQTPDLPEARIGYCNADINKVLGDIVSVRERLISSGTRIAPLKAAFTRFQGPLKPEENDWSSEIIVDFTDHRDFSLDLSRTGYDTIGSFIGDLVRDYGWSITTLDTRNKSIDDKVIVLLDDSTRNKGSKLRSLDLGADSLSLASLKCVQQIISRSKFLEHLVIEFRDLDKKVQQEKAVYLLHPQQKILDKLTGLILHSDSSVSEVKWLQGLLLTRKALPKLTEFRLLLLHGKGNDDESFGSWISTMVSASATRLGLITPPNTRMKSTPILPPHAETEPTSAPLSSQTPVSSPQTGVTTPPPSTLARNIEQWSSLKRIGLCAKWLSANDWSKIIEAIDFSVLEELNLKKTNLGSDQLDLLIKCIGKVHGVAPLRTLSLPSPFGDADPASVGLSHSQRSSMHQKGPDPSREKKLNKLRDKALYVVIDDT